MAQIKIYSDLTIGEVDDRLFSSFLEHLGRAVYGGIYDPKDERSDEMGFRKDVIALIQELGINYIRYPGGNFVSGYNWRDGVGDYRPKRIDYAWRSIETNEIGINEFYEYTKKTNTKIMGAVNLGTGTPQDAADFIEYCNFPAGTELSDLRIKHGHKEPRNIDIWCLGNEMDGDHQTCALNAEDYAKKARETAKMMKAVDPSIELVAVGSSSCNIPTYPEWDRKVIEELYDYVDYLSMHIYYENKGNDEEFLMSCYNLDGFIKSLVATLEHVKTIKRSDKKIYLSLDEWNVWNFTDWTNLNYENKPMEELEIAPKLLEDNYTYIDAIVFASLTIVILNNSDRLKIACLAQLVNVIGPILVENGKNAVKQTIFYPFKYFSKYGRGEVLQTNNECLELGDKSKKSIVSSCVYDKDENELNIFVVNLHLSEEQEVEFKFGDFKDVQFIEQIVLEEDDFHAVNNFDNPNRIIPKVKDKLDVKLRACSYSLYRFKVNK